MALKYYVVAGLGVLGLSGYLGLKLAGPPASPLPLAEVALPDLDQDARPERLWLAPTADGRTELRLDSSRSNFTHEVLGLPALAGARFEGENGRWRLLDAEGQVRAHVRVATTAPDSPPDMVVLASAQGKRYHWVDRGFLKLDALTVIPGFSVGLVMIGDPQSALEAIDGALATDGAWSLGLDEPLDFHVKLSGARRVTSVRYASPRMRTMGGPQLGATLAALEEKYPGRREGDRYVSPRYGLIVELDGMHKARAFTIARPWAAQ